MIEAPLQRRTPLPPQLTRRVGVLGVLAFVLFGIIVFRLWYLQVLTGPQNANAASQNVVRTIAIPPPRGNILDDQGNVLATSRYATQVAIVADELPPNHTKARRSLYQRLGAVLGMPWKQIRATVDDAAVAPPGYAPTGIADNVSTHVLAYLGERKRSYPGVVEQTVPVRSYPFGSLASVVLGTVGEISGRSPGSKGELGRGQYKGVAAGSIVGQSGLESQYQAYLQGTPGAETVTVDASGFPVGRETLKTAPSAGDQLVTSLNLDLEREGYSAIQQAELAARHNGDPAPAGSFIAMDPVTGRVLALGSLPTYNANDFATPISEGLYKHIGATKEDLDRAIDGAYPTGSTFKPITALAGLETGLITPQTLQGAGSSYTVGSGAAAQSFRNSGGEDDGPQDLVNALALSEDTYFYPIGAEANVGFGHGGAIQRVARELGLGSSPGIDVGDGGYAGIVPDADYTIAANEQDAAQFCDGSRPKPQYATDQLAITGCGQGYFEPPWTVGQNIQLATGQGMLEATPLQMAVAYSAIVNGGTVWQPQIGEEILSASGQVVQQLPAPRVVRHLQIDPTYQAAIMQGLHDAAQSPEGTSYPTFASFPYTVYGKTGTAQHANGQQDQSWYVAYVPDGSRSIVVAVTIEEGGFGAAAAAPAARLILSQWLGVKKAFISGSSQDQ